MPDNGKLHQKSMDKNTTATKDQETRQESEETLRSLKIKKITEEKRRRFELREAKIIIWKKWRIEDKNKKSDTSKRQQVIPEFFLLLPI